MKTRLRINPLVVALLLALIFTELTTAEGLFAFESEKLTWVFEGLPDQARGGNFLAMRVQRKHEANLPLDVTLSPLIDEYGNEFPRELVVIKTPYDSAEQSWSGTVSSKRLLAASDDYVDLEIGVYYHAAVPAGIYRGELFAEYAESVPIEIIVGRYTYVIVDPPEIKLEVSSGPGTYTAEDLVQVEVVANHPEWVLRLSSAGLFYLDEEQSGRNSVLDRLKEPVVDPLELFIIHENQQVSLYEAPLLSGIDYEWSSIFEFKIQTEVGWEHKAGKYAGVIQVDVETIN